MDRTARLACALGLAMCVAVGCSSEPEAPVGFVTPTTIAVDPGSFLGNLVCADLEGAVRSYVAVVTDTTLVPPFKLPASAPVPCSQPAEFRFVTIGHTYTAEVDAYDHDASDLKSFGPGSRDVLLGDKVIAPRWTTSCDTETAAQQNVEVSIEGCAALQPNGTVEGTTEVVVDPSAALGAFQCGGDVGQVSTFDVTPVGLDSQTVACGDEPLVCPGPSCVEDVVGGQLYEFRVAGYDSGKHLLGASSCFAIAQEGLTISAICDAITELGSVHFDIGAALKAAGLVCGDQGVFQVCKDACDDSSTIMSQVLPCSQDEVRIDGLTAGTDTFELVVHGAESAGAGGAGGMGGATGAGGAGPPTVGTCTATIVPGATVEGVCTLPL